jgi:hypothetical protein
MLFHRKRHFLFSKSSIGRVHKNSMLKFLKYSQCQCHEIFDLWFFHQTIPPSALIHGLKPFRIWLRIRRVNRVGNSQNRLPRSDRDRGSRCFCKSSPLTGAFSYSCKYVMFTYVFVFAIVSL